MSQINTGLIFKTREDGRKSFLLSSTKDRDERYQVSNKTLTVSKIFS